MDNLCNGDFTFENLPGMCFAFSLVCCCILPLALCSFVVLVSIAVNLVLFCPPLAVIVSALPCLRSKEYHVFQHFEKSPESRADPSQQGHVTKWYEVGWIRALIICTILTCFGFFPGVILAAYIGIYHVIRYWSH